MVNSIKSLFKVYIDTTSKTPEFHGLNHERMVAENYTTKNHIK